MTAVDPKEWTEPGAFEVAPGVHRIPLPLPMDGLRAVNVYAIATDDGLTLIDGGWAIDEARNLLEQSLKSIDREVSDITRFLVTHVHRDHYTQAVMVRREFGSHISLGIGDKPTLDLIHSTDLTEDPHVVELRRAGAADIAKEWADFTADSTPDLTMWEYPD
ncbi:MAG: MBL fold metallo-hydrolase, partial [Nocardioides sp.]|nr:MBL fold metallo-hydrolase [Nocardioides sp.]